jgi:hypothetical protein
MFACVPTPWCVPPCATTLLLPGGAVGGPWLSNELWYMCPLTTLWVLCFGFQLNVLAPLNPPLHPAFPYYFGDELCVCLR